jgi:glycosyltransferase involved in cell wall biosynthesis
MLKQSERARVIFSVTNCICYDQRVLKMAGVVSDLGGNVTIVGRDKSDCPGNISVPFRTRRFKMLFNRGFLFYKFFSFRLLFYLLFNRCDLLVSNDLDTLLPNFIVSKLKGIPLVYDSHEYFTGVPELTDRPIVRIVWTTIERIIFPLLQHVITVSEPIALLYEKLYRVKPVVIRNCGRNSDHILPFPRTEFNIPEDDLLIILQGGGINIDKGAEELIDALSMTEKVSLLIVGGGDVISKLKNRVMNLNLEQKVKFINRMAWDVLMRYTKTADTGMCLEKDTNLNYRFSLANKLFDYISAGLPVIASDLPEVTKIVNGYNCGIIISSVTPDEIASALQLLEKNRDLLKVLKKNAREASEVLNWENESVKVREFYSMIFKTIYCSS